MHASSIQASRLAACPRPFPRIINVVQHLFPGSPFRGTPVDLGKGWAAEPKSLTVAGQTIAVAHIASRGEPFDRYQVVLPKLPDGQHSAVVTLAKGIKVRVLLNVTSTH